MARSMVGLNPQYYEAILQLRDVSEEMIQFAQKEIRNRQLHIVRTKMHETGVDYYLPDKDLAKAIGKKLQLNFGGKCIVTAKLFSKKDDRLIYRLTILFRGLSFNKNDVVTYKGIEYTVKNLANEILLQNEKNGKKARVKYKDTALIKKKEQN
jgi:NMD protein affecting ribosome stability and mRNA decay